MPVTAEKKARIQALRVELTALTAGFCAAHLDDEHAALAAALVAKMARNRQVPFLRGAPALWAATVIYSLAQINFLFDRGEAVHTTPDEIAAFFGVNKNTVAGRAKALRELMGLRPFDAEFSNAQMRATGRRIRNISTLIGLGIQVQELEEDDSPGE
jgi:hypothetical protein